MESALPVIDTGPPAYRSHVAMKLKKQQKENERCKKIEQDNFLLLQKMNYIMKTTRVDNAWKTPQPTFLNRVAVYTTAVPKFEDLEFDIGNTSEDEDQRHGRKSKCVACTKQKTDNLKVHSIIGHSKETEGEVAVQKVLFIWLMVYSMFFLLTENIHTHTMDSFFHLFCNIFPNLPNGS